MLKIYFILTLTNLNVLHDVLEENTFPILKYILGKCVCIFYIVYNVQYKLIERLSYIYFFFQYNYVKYFCVIFFL